MQRVLCIIFCLVAFFANAVTIEQLEHLYEQNELKELAKQFPQADKNARERIEYLFFDALVENDGKTAVQKYKSFLSAFPNSKYADDALYRLAMFHYSQGQDHTCRVLLRGFIRNFPQSEYIPDVEFVIGQTFFNERQSDSAAIALQNFMQKHPRSSKVDIAVTDLESLGGISVSELESTAEKNFCFTIQVGTFNSVQIANRVAEKLEAKFKYVSVYETPLQPPQYALCIGLFNSRANAENYAENYIRSVIKDCSIVSCSDFNLIDR